jgi:hypothetical protein
LNTLKNRYFKLDSIFWSVLLFVVVAAGCKKGDESLGMNLITGASTIETKYFQEKGTITSYTFSDEKIRTDRPKINQFGSFIDPLFGRTDGSFAAQFRLPYHPDYDRTASVDSLVLYMTYKMVYGDTINTQTVKVYELQDDLIYDAKYLSSFNPKILASPLVIGTTSYIPKFRTDSAQTDTVAQTIRVRLNPSLGTRLLKIDSLEMVNNDSFLELFKGLYIESVPVNKRGALIGISSSSTTLGLYYHTNKKDSLSYGYKVTSNSAVVAGFKHDYTNSVFFPNMNQEVVQDSLVFIQPLGGTKVKVNVPSLSKWKDSTNYLINRATLTFYVDTLVSHFYHYQIPSRVYLKIIDNEGTEVFPKDAELSNSYYGGYYNYLTGAYSFNIAQHLQQVIDGEIEDTSFYLVHNERNSSAKRVVLKSGSSSRPMELLVEYTRYR